MNALVSSSRTHLAAQYSTASGRLWLAVAALSMLGGAVLLVWAAYNISQAGTDSRPQPALLPYENVLVEEGGPGDFPDLGQSQHSAAQIRRYEIRASGIERPLAKYMTAEQASASPVLLSWQSQLAEPVLMADVEFQEVDAVAEVLAKHLPPGAVVFAWWDISRQLHYLQNITTVFEGAEPEPIFLPALWREHRPAIAQQQKAFWSPQAHALDSPSFSHFQEVLLGDPQAGIAELTSMAKGQKPYLVLNVLDAYKAGFADPGALGVGFKDFARSGDTHGLIKRVKSWMKDSGYSSFLVHPLDSSVIRAIYLSDQSSEQSLLTALLPFNGSRPDKVQGVKLVHQYRGYWVYEITGRQ